MQAPSTTRITIGFVLAFVLLAVNSAVSYVTLDKLVAANHLVAETEQTVRLLGDLRAIVIDAESSVRDFTITGEKRDLDPYLNALKTHPAIFAKLKAAARQTADGVAESAPLTLLGNLIDQRFDFLNEAIAINELTSARTEQSALAISALIRSDKGKLVMDRMRRTIDELQDRERVRLASRTADFEYNAYISTVTNAIATIINVCLLGGLFFLVRRDAAVRRKSVAAEREFNDKLALSLAVVQQRNEEITFLSQMSSFLLTCANSEEACVAIARFGPLLFPTESGVIYLFHASRNYVESVASWGNGGSKVSSEEMFPPADCWALRRGRLHSVGAEGTSMVCAHVARTHPTIHPYICAPMMAQGETLGLLFLQSHSSDGSATALSESKQQLAAAVAEQIALALSNLKLRETLRQQSVRDPLTGLYNRRFLEETLDRELSRLERKNLPLSLIMIDVDNFKNFNDTFGHEAGDAVLRDLGGVLQRYVRGSDIACRYGGEEFTVILPEADIDIGRERAEMLRGAARELRLVHDGKSLGAVTLSLGVACFPGHGRRREHLLQAADAALYEAKNRGRDSVVVSNVKTLKVVEKAQQRDQGGH